MERPWLNSYPTGVSADIDVNKYNSVVEIFEKSVERVLGEQNPHLAILVKLSVITNLLKLLQQSPLTYKTALG
jgi:hypothetical protein